MPGPESTDERLDVHLEHGEQVVSFDAAPSELAERGHRCRNVLRKVGRGPVDIDTQADDRARVGGPEAARLAEDAADLADPAGTALVTHRDDEVVGPFEPDGPRGQPGGRLGRLGHRDRRNGRQSPDLCRREPAGPEPERHEQRGIGRATHVRPCRPRPAVCSSATRRQTSGVPSTSQSRTTSFVDPTRARCSRRARNGVIEGASLIPRPRCRRRRPRVARARRRRGARAGRSRGRPRRSCR